MLISSQRIVSVTEANQNFNKIIKDVNKFGDIVIFKRNKPAYILIDINKMGDDFIREYEQLKLKYISDNLLQEYHEAYKALAK
jgi:antitoxin Phd